MQVLGVQHDQQERQHDADVGEQRNGFDPHVGGGAERRQQGGHPMGEERTPAVGEGLAERVDRGAAEECKGQDDQEDHEQNQPGTAGVRTVEARRAAVLLGLRAQPDDREHDDAEQYRGGEEVLQEAERIPPADQRNMEFGGVEQNAVGLEIHRREDEEAPTW